MRPLFSTLITVVVAGLTLGIPQPIRAAYLDSTSATGNSTTPNVAVPVGVASGDIVILVSTFDNTAASYESGDWPTGFTELAEVDVTCDGQTTAIGWKRLTGADSGSYTFGAVNGTAGDWITQAFAFTGRHASDPPVVSTNASSNTCNAEPVTVTANAVTAVNGDDLLWASGADPNLESAPAIDYTSPTNYTEREEASAPFSGLGGHTRDNVSGGDTGTVAGSFVFGGSVTGAGWVAWLVRVPVAGGGAVPTRLLLLLGVGDAS